MGSVATVDALGVLDMSEWRTTIGQFAEKIRAAGQSGLIDMICLNVVRQIRCWREEVRPPNLFPLLPPFLLSFSNGTTIGCCFIVDVFEDQRWRMSCTEFLHTKGPTAKG